jgi:phosphate transport system substrate-binding protein
MTAIANNFSQEYPSVELNLSDGGNDAGFAQWIAGQIDIADASRKIKPDESQEASAKGFNITETKVGVESIAFITSPGLDIGPLEPSQLKAIYSGAVTNWKEVGGPDMPIILFAPPPGGSPYLFFNNIFMTGTPFAGTVTYINDTSDLAGRVANDTGSIGFIRSGYLNRTENVTAISIRTDSSSPAYSPTDFPAALNNSYAFSRNYYIYTNGPLKNGTGIWAYYILSEERGQKILAEYGFVPLNESDLNQSRTHIESISDTPIEGYKVYREAANGTTEVFETNETFFNDTSVKAG